MTNEQKVLLETRYKQFYVKGWDQLLAKLKTYGGEMIVPMPEPERHVKWLLSDGHIFDNSKITLKEGEPHRCHENAARLWAENNQLQLVTGYVLEYDGLWLQHSWCWNPDSGELIETSKPAKKYFGFVMDELEAFRFATANVPDYKMPGNATPRIFKCAAIIVKLFPKVDKSLIPLKTKAKPKRKKTKK